MVLIAIGLALLIGQVVPNGGRYIVLIVGAALLAGGIATRAYGLVVPGGIVTGVGVGILLDAAEPGRGGSGLFLLSLGLGFISIWLVASLLRLPENHPWPFIPGLILTSIGALSVAGTGYGRRFGSAGRSSSSGSGWRSSCAPSAAAPGLTQRNRTPAAPDAAPATPADRSAARAHRAEERPQARPLPVHEHPDGVDPGGDPHGHDDRDQEDQRRQADLGE